MITNSERERVGIDSKLLIMDYDYDVLKPLQVSKEKLIETNTYGDPKSSSKDIGIFERTLTHNITGKIVIKYTKLTKEYSDEFVETEKSEFLESLYRFQKLLNSEESLNSEELSEYKVFIKSVSKTRTEHKMSNIERVTGEELEKVFKSLSGVMSHSVDALKSIGKSIVSSVKKIADAMTDDKRKRKAIKNNEKRF